MSEADKVFEGSIPEIYDEYLVPLIFEPYARDMARRVAESTPVAVLETAAGSGVVTRALAPLLDNGSRFVVSDLNQPMLDRAAGQQPDAGRIEWQQADALDLPFEAGSFDVVCCQFGVMFFPDKAAGCAEARRVLRPGGRFIFNVWDRIEENAFPDCVTKTVSRLYPNDPPVFLARTPHGHHDTRIIEGYLREAGFDDIEVHTVTKNSVADSPRQPAVAFCQGTPLRNELETRDPGKLEEITGIAEADLRQRFGGGRISGQIQGHVFVATA